MTSSASGAGGVGTDIPNYLGRKEKKRGRKEKKKKNPAGGATLCPTFFGVKFVSRLRNVKCSVAIVDTDQPKSGEEPAGAVGCGRGRSERRATVGRSFYDK